MKDEAMKLALEALEWMVANDDTNEGDEPVERLGGQSWNEYNAYWIDGLNKARASITAIKQALAAPVQEPVAHGVIAGALFDFMGWLTSRPKRIMLSSSDDASPAVDAITEFAKMRGLSLDDARVQDWQDYTTPPAAQRQWVGLTDEEIEKACVPLGAAMLSFTEVARVIEAKLKEKNT